MRWNLSSRARELSGADLLVLSIPKSGRTWLRTFLSAYFAAKIGRDFALDLTDGRTPGVPRIVYSHDRFEHRTKGNWWDRARGKYLVPACEARNKPVVLLVRDPRDAFISYYVQLTRRNPAVPEKIKRASAGFVLRHPRFGIAVMVETLNRWLREFASRHDFMILRYEDLLADPPKWFQELLRAVIAAPFDPTAFTYSLQFSRFDNMRRLEASGAFGDKILQPGNPDDPQSFKVRSGNIGGFAQYLSSDDQEFAGRVCQKLDPRFRYNICQSALGTNVGTA